MPDFLFLKPMNILFLTLKIQNMNFNKIHRFFPFMRLVKVLFFIAFSLQLIIISQVYFYKPEFFNEPVVVISRLLRGILLTFIAGFILSYPFLFLIRKLSLSLPWKMNAFKRFFIQFPIAIVLGLLITPIILILAAVIFSLKFDSEMIINNSYYFIVMSLFLMIILEALIYFNESSVAKTIAENLEKELLQIRFEVLKSQINPHFMFNSLNVLSGLINVDIAKAQLFIDEFSQVYRYVLDTIEQPVVTLSKELEFMRSYLFLQQIRYGATLSYSLDIPSELLQMALPPLSVQVLLENAIKHNIVNEAKPLKIEIFSDGVHLIVKNNIQPKISGTSTGLGLKNLTKRYALVCKQEPAFKIVNNYYIARIPLIKIEQDERTDY